MTGYVIRKICKATNDNPNYAGEVQRFNLIKRGYNRYIDEPIWCDEAYKSRGIAERVMRKTIEDYNYYKELCYKYWDCEFEVIEVETIGGKA